MIFYILDTLSNNDAAFVENKLKVLGRDEDYTIVRCSSMKLSSLNIGYLLGGLWLYSVVPLHQDFLLL